MSFTAKMVGANKREVREKLYDDVAGLLKGPTRFAMLAGGAPGEEINCIRRRFYRPQIVAFDLAQSCVDAAAACSVEAVRGNVAFANVLGDRTFDFFDLDLCKTVSTSGRAIRAAAKAATGALAVFASYRDNATNMETAREQERAKGDETTIKCERATIDETTTKEERATCSEITTVSERANFDASTMLIERATAAETTTSIERAMVRETTTTDKLTSAQQLRIDDALRIIREVRPGAQLRRAFAYKGNALNMIGLLVYFGRKQIETLPPFCPHREEDTAVRRHRLRTLGIGGHALEKRIRAGARGAK